MTNLFDLFHFETEKYYVFIDNILGHCSMVTIMTKDNSRITDDCPLSTCMVGFIESTFDIKFSWHSNVKSLPEQPFDPDVLLEKYKVELDRLLKK